MSNSSSERIVDQHALIDEVLSIWGPALGPDRAPYVAHVYRVYNYARQLSDLYVVAGLR